MTEQERIEYVYQLFDCIISDVKDLKGDNYTIYFDPESVSLTTRDFIFSFDSKSLLFMLSFAVGQMSSTVANFTSIILSYIEAHELLILKDYFFDKEEKEVYYGDEAVSQKQLALLKTLGKDKCVMCDNIVPSEIINKKTKICKVCEQDYDKFIWC